MRNTLVPQLGQTPRVAGLLFFRITFWGFFISTFFRHLKQYACTEITPFIRFKPYPIIYGMSRPLGRFSQHQQAKTFSGRHRFRSETKAQNGYKISITIIDATIIRRRYQSIGQGKWSLLNHTLERG